MAWRIPINPICGMPNDLIISLLVKYEQEKQVIKDAINEDKNH